MAQAITQRQRPLDKNRSSDDSFISIESLDCLAIVHGVAPGVCDYREIKGNY
jgi:hypothetical protein